MALVHVPAKLVKTTKRQNKIINTNLPSHESVLKFYLENNNWWTAQLYGEVDAWGVGVDCLSIPNLVFESDLGGKDLICINMAAWVRDSCILHYNISWPVQELMCINLPLLVLDVKHTNNISGSSLMDREACFSFKHASSRSWHWVLRYVGILWFVFHVRQLPPIRFTQQNFVLHWQIYYETSTKTGLKIKPPLI